MESINFVHYHAEKEVLFLDFNLEFHCKMKALNLQKEFFYSVSACVPHGKYGVIQLCCMFECFALNFSQEDISISTV